MMKLTSNKIFSFMLAAAFAMTLAGCGGGGGGAAMDDTTDTTVMPVPEPTPQQMCEDGGGLWDMMACTTAEMLAAEVMAKTNSAGTKEEAIETEANTDGAGGPGGDDAAVIAIAHKDGAVSISVSRGMGDEKVDFMKAMDLTGADDHAGSMNVLGPNDDGETEIAIVYTDIGAPTPTKFGGMGTNTSLDVRKDGESVTDDDPADSMTVTGGTDELARIMGFASPAAGSASVMHTFDPAREDVTSTTDMDESRDAAEVMGSYNGAMGTYRCNDASDTATCTATVNAMGEVTAISTNWIFTPAKGETVDVADGDYLHYGVWLMKTAQDDGSDEYNQVETFADSSLLEATNVAQVTGSASYKGGAAGVYVRNVYIASTEGVQELDYANSGHFTAAVNLTATFDQVPVSDTDSTGTIAPNLINTVSGTIDGFTLSGGEDASGWGVDVQADINGADLENGTAKGGGGDDGSISGNFRGTETDDDGDPIAPTALVGEFNAEFTNGSVAGGYGARRK